MEGRSPVLGGLDRGSFPFELTMARWGVIPFWMKEKPKVPHINARAYRRGRDVEARRGRDTAR
jgi:hypothetical protein